MEACQPLHKQQNHQQFKFGNSCLLFFFEETPIDQKASQSVLKPGLRRSNLVSECQPRKKLQYGKQNSPTNHTQNVKPSTCSGSRVKNLYSTISRGETTDRSGRKTDHKKCEKQQQFIKKVNATEQQKQCKQKQQHIKVEIEEKSIILSSKQIMQLFGYHHKLYHQQIDYLIMGRTQQIQVNQSQNQIVQTPLTQENNSSTQYPSHAERAPIFLQFQSKPLTNGYDKLVNLNLKQSRYLDQQFCIQDILGKDHQQIVYISPSATLRLFPNNTQHSLQLKQHASDLPMVNFMKFMHQSDSRFFTRLIEPPINNVFAVWLFYESCFQPIIIDGYFPTHIGLHSQNNNENLWIAIFSKCICKLFNTLDIKKLKKISPSQIYQLVTGFQLKTVKTQQLAQSTDKLSDLCKHARKKNKTIFYSRDGIFKQVTQNQCKQLSLQLSTINKQVSTQRSQLELYLLPAFKNHFISSVSVFRKAVTKFEIECSYQCSISFIAPKSEIGKHLRVYIYKQNEDKLSLVYEVIPSASNWTKLKSGNYKLFYEDTCKAMEHFFDKTKKNQDYIQDRDSTYSMTIMTSCEVKLTKQQILFKSQDTIQDSLHYYSIS